MTGKSFHDRQCKARFNIRKQKWSLQIYVHNTTVDKIVTQKLRFTS